MNVLVVAPSIPTKEEPLNGVFAFDQALALSGHGIAVKVAAVDLRSIRHKRKWGLEYYKKNGIECAIYNFPLGAVPIKMQVLVGQVLLKKVYRCLYHDGTFPDVVHAHFTEIGAMAVTVCKENELPLILTEHSSAITEPVIREGIRKCALYVYPRCKKVIAVSKALAKRIYEISNVDATVIHNIVDTSVFNYIGKKDLGSKYKFVTVGSLIEVKNHMMLIDALAKVYESDKEVMLDIVGEGPLHSFLQKRIQEKGLGNVVRLLGFKNRDEIKDIYNQADCFVLPSRLETFGVVSIEAMAAGLPVIATRCGGPEEYVNEITGMLVENSVEQLAAGMISMKKKRGIFDMNKISQFAHEMFSDENISGQVYEVYRNCLEMDI